ncbi:MAG: hypothetical protein E7161_00860 [Firmicutes bacterium]|nr:hypothetical protein [Bacillota bacterium]
MNLNEMSIEEKINILESLITRANTDLDYSLSVRWGQNKETSILELQMLVNGAKELFLTGRINSIDYEERINTVGVWSKALNEALRKFPEIYDNLNQEVPKL